MSGKKQINAEAREGCPGEKNRQGGRGAALSTGTDMLEQLFEESCYAYALVDIDSCRLVKINSTAIDMLGTGGEYENKLCRDYFRCTPEECKACTRYCRESGERRTASCISEQGKYLSVVTEVRQFGNHRVVFKQFVDETEKRRTEEELSRREQALEAVLHQSGLNYWEYYMHEDRVVSSDASIVNLGVPGQLENFPESFISQGLLLPKYEEQYRKLHEDIKAGIPTRTVEQQAKLGDGSVAWQRVRYDTIFDDDGYPIKAIASCIDITKDKELQERYEDMLALRDATVHNSVAAFLVDLTHNRVRSIVDKDPKIRAMHNHKIEDLTDYVLARIPGRRQREEYRRVSDRSRLLWLYQKQGISNHSAVFSYAPDGLVTKWMEITACISKEPSSGDVLMYAYVMDVTERTVKERLLSLVGDMFVHTMVHIDSPSTAVTVFSVGRERPEHYLSYESFIDSTCRQLVSSGYVLPEEKVIASLSFKAISEELSVNREYSVTVRLEGGNGTRFHKINCYYVDEQRTDIAIVCADITGAMDEQQRQQRLLEDALDRAERATKAKSEFLSSVSHDMRTPMNGILGLASLTLEMEGLPDEARENLQSLVQSSHFLLQLINDTLDMSRIESNKIQLTLQPASCDAVVDNVVMLVMPTVSSKQQHLIINKTGEQNCRLMMDKIRLEQILLNLLSNAVKFTPVGGKIELFVHCGEVINGRAATEIVVRDNGCGMSEEFLPRLFEPFAQEGVEPTGSRNGTGLGMPIVKSLLEIMGGTIEVESARGRGTAITLRVDFEAAGETDRLQSSGPRKLPVKNLAGKRVLFVEDHPVNVAVGRKMLQSKGVEVVHAENGRIAVEAFAASPVGSFDAVLMDILMPEMDGYEATQNIRGLKRGDARTVPIIAMTANAFSEDVKKCMDAGMNAHLAKPVEPELLWKTLSEHIAARTDRN